MYTGSLVIKDIDEIGTGIDFCLIDTRHVIPGEILDFLMILPYLTENATVVFHDTNLHTTGNSPRFFYERCIVNNLLVSAVFGKKLVQGNFLIPNIGKVCFPNITAIKLNADTRYHIFEIFNLLTINWQYLPIKSDWMKIISHFERYYEKYYLDYLNNVYTYQEKIVGESRRFILRCWNKIGKILGIIR